MRVGTEVDTQAQDKQVVLHNNDKHVVEEDFHNINVVG